MRSPGSFSTFFFAFCEVGLILSVQVVGPSMAWGCRRSIRLHREEKGYGWQLSVRAACGKSILGRKGCFWLLAIAVSILGLLAVTGDQCSTSASRWGLTMEEPPISPLLGNEEGGKARSISFKPPSIASHTRL